MSAVILKLSAASFRLVPPIDWLLVQSFRALSFSFATVLRPPTRSSEQAAYNDKYSSILEAIASSGVKTGQNAEQCVESLHIIG